MKPKIKQLIQYNDTTGMKHKYLTFLFIIVISLLIFGCATTPIIKSDYKNLTYHFQGIQYDFKVPNHMANFTDNYFMITVMDMYAPDDDELLFNWVSFTVWKGEVEVQYDIVLYPPKKEILVLIETVGYNEVAYLFKKGYPYKAKTEEIQKCLDSYKRIKI